MLNERGSILVQTLIAIVLITIATFTIFYTDLSFKRTSFRKAQGEASMNVLIQKMTRLSQAEFLKLAEYCRDKNLLGTNLKEPLACLDSNGKIKQSASPDAFNKIYELEAPLDEAGHVTNDPQKIKSCVEIVLCEPKGAGHLLEVVLSQAYDAPAMNKVETRERFFRRTRW